MIESKSTDDGSQHKTMANHKRPSQLSFQTPPPSTPHHDNNSVRSNPKFSKSSEKKSLSLNKKPAKNVSISSANSQSSTKSTKFRNSRSPTATKNDKSRDRTASNIHVKPSLEIPSRKTHSSVPSITISPHNGRRSSSSKSQSKKSQ